MSTILRQELDSYLGLRRSLGFSLKNTGILLEGFLSWLEERGKDDDFTIDDAVSWARAPADAKPIWWSQRLVAIRPFAAWLNAKGLEVAIIPPRLLPATTTRRTPYIYTQTELDRLLRACPLFFSHPRVVATMSTIIALLAGTGLRIGEALSLHVGDLDTTANLLHIYGRKRPLDRVVPLHPTTTQGLLDYLDSPARVATHPGPKGPIFVNNRGHRLVTETIEQHFRALTTALGMVNEDQPRPRLHDFRHTFATRHMIAAYANELDPDRTLTLLSTWLGHTGPEHTYWYLSAVPELLAAAAQRLQNSSLKGSES